MSNTILFLVYYNHYVHIDKVNLLQGFVYIILFLPKNIENPSEHESVCISIICLKNIKKECFTCSSNALEYAGINLFRLPLLLISCTLL